MSNEVPEGGDVPRGTSPPSAVSAAPELPPVTPGSIGPEPESAPSVFGDRVEVARRYVEILADAGVERGLIGPREIPRLWDRHVLNCAYVAELIDEGASVVDVGSGAGLPGIPIAIARPDLRVRLVEPLERRYHFLREAVSQLGLRDQIAVVRSRAEDIRGDFSGKVVTARAVAPLASLYGWTLPLVQPGGHLLAIKGRTAADEIAAAADTLSAMGVSAAPEVLSCGPTDGTGTTVVRVERGNGPLRSPSVLSAPATRRRGGGARPPGVRRPTR